MRTATRSKRDTRSPGIAALASRRVALHAARVGGRFAALAVLRGGGQAAFRPVRADLNLVPALLEFGLGGLWRAALHDDHARARGAAPEGREEMLCVPGRRVDRFLQV